MNPSKCNVSVLLENRPDLLSRAVSLLHRRSFEVESFHLGHTDRDSVARLTVVINGRQGEGERLARELLRLVQVIRVDASEKPAVDRYHALIKIAADAHNRPEVIQLCEVFHAQIVDVARSCLIVELTGAESKIGSFLEVVRPFGIVEMVRSGPMSLGRADHILDEHEPDSAPVSSWTKHRSRIGSTKLN